MNERLNTFINNFGKFGIPTLAFANKRFERKTNQSGVICS